jgi:hypothetical protein
MCVTKCRYCTSTRTETLYKPDILIGVIKVGAVWAHARAPRVWLVIYFSFLLHSPFIPSLSLLNHSSMSALQPDGDGVPASGDPSAPAYSARVLPLLCWWLQWWARR